MDMRFLSLAPAVAFPEGGREGGTEGGCIMRFGGLERWREEEGEGGREGTYRRFSTLSSSGSLDSSVPPAIQGSCNSS